MRLLFVGVVVAGFAVHSVPKEPANLEGKWEIVSQQYNGGRSFTCPNSSITFTEDKMLYATGRRTITYTYTTDSKVNPKKIDLTCVSEPFKSQTFLAIYEADGETLKLNMGGRPDVTRPTEFGSEKEEGSRHHAFYLKRVND